MLGKMYEMNILGRTYEDSGEVLKYTGENKHLARKKH